MKMSAPLSSPQSEERLMDKIQAVIHQHPPEQQNQVLQQLQQSVQPSELVQQIPPESTQQEPVEDSEQQTMPPREQDTLILHLIHQGKIQQQIQQQLNLQQEMLLQQQQQIQQLLGRHDANRIEIYQMVITGLPAVILSATAGYAVFKLANSDKLIDALCESVKSVTGAFVQRISPGSVSLSVVAETPAIGKQVMEACKSSELMDDLNQKIEKYESEKGSKVGRITSIRIVSKRIEDVTSDQLGVLKENAVLCIDDIKKRSVEEYEVYRNQLLVYAVKLLFLGIYLWRKL